MMVWLALPQSSRASVNAPALIAYAETNWAGTGYTGTSKSSPSVSWLAGDTVVVMAGTFTDGSGSMSAPTGTGLSFGSMIAGYNPGNGSGLHSQSGVWAATPSSAGSSAITLDFGVVFSGAGFGVWVFRNSGGVGLSTEQHTFAKTVSLTSSAAHSAVVWASFDFGAGANPAATPTSPNPDRRQAQVVTNFYTVLVADIQDQPSTSAVSYGQTGGTGPNSIVLLEIKGDTGVQVSSRSDILSDARPSATSNHTITFITNTAIYGSSLSGSSTLKVIFDPSFTFSANIDCGDVDAATSVQFNFNYPGCIATATAWGFSVTSSAITLTPPSGTGVYVPTSTQVTINIGSNATVGQQGAHWITDPSTVGIYTISVGGTFGGSGNMLVSINLGVTVQATVAESLALTVSSVAAVNCTADDGATVTAIGTTSTTIPFGNVSLNTFYIGCQDLVVSTNAGGGYSITTQESSVMKTSDGRFTIPDTTCDGGTCTESAAAAWTTPTKNGLGHTCFNQDGNHDCDSSYTNGTKFRQFANIAGGETPQAIMSSSTPASVTARIKHRLSAGTAQAAGAYTTLITYTIYATY